MEEQAKRTKPTREENFQRTKEELLFQQKLAREGKLSEYLKARRAQREKEEPDWDILVR